MPKRKRRRKSRPKTAQGLSNRIGRKLGIRAPLVKLSKCRKCAKGGWSGRYHPRSKTISQSEDAQMPERLKPVLTDHEVSHWATRHIHCGPQSRHSKLLRRVRAVRKCTYNGEHDARFYRTLEKIHRANGVGPKAAVELELASGYNPPKTWMKAAKRGRW